jgi:hypothetical protein
VHRPTTELQLSFCFVQELRNWVRVHDQCHTDALTHMVLADSLTGGGDVSRLLLTASRDGAVKAWK